jgi:hypothetical protein
MNGNEYISRPVLFISAKISSIQNINSNAAISLSATDLGFLVAMTIPAKNDWDIPIYNNGIRYSMNKISYYL